MVIWTGNINLSGAQVFIRELSLELRLESVISWSLFSHEAKRYTDKVENDMFVTLSGLPSLSETHIEFLYLLLLCRLGAMDHPRCVGWGEIGLDYHYDNSPRDVQQDVFIRQLRNAVKLGKPITIHTREAEQDTERILKEEVPKDHKVILTNNPFFVLCLDDPH